MDIILAGFNIDNDVLTELTRNTKRDDVTPETISAAYARISRNPKPVNELRKIARQEVSKARKSNRNIIFSMGHHSVAEHAVFNFDILGVSRLAIEAIEHFRLCSFTEKSQRYIKLKDDYVLPPEIKGTKEEKHFCQSVLQQNQSYLNFYKALNKDYKEKPLHVGSEKEIKRAARMYANQDARYVLSLATLGQLGMTVNARNFELLLRRFASSHRLEIQEIGQKLYDCVKSISPSIVLFTEANPYDQSVYDDLKKHSEKFFSSQEAEIDTEEVKLLGYPQDADKILVTSLLNRVHDVSYETCRKKVDQLSYEECHSLIQIAFRHVELYDAVLREFEFLNLHFELVVSASCFAQLKRHRMSTISVQDYLPALGVTIPPSIQEVGLEEDFYQVMKTTEKCYYSLFDHNPVAAPYILTNAHRRRVHFGCNARELYHISRLREDQYAQWDIRNIAQQMSSVATATMPLTTMFLCGKDNYPQLYEKIFGQPPKVTHAQLPEEKPISLEKL